MKRTENRVSKKDKFLKDIDKAIENKQSISLMTNKFTVIFESDVKNLKNLKRHVEVFYDDKLHKKYFMRLNESRRSRIIKWKLEK